MQNGALLFLSFLPTWALQFPLSHWFRPLHSWQIQVPISKNYRNRAELSLYYWLFNTLNTLTSGHFLLRLCGVIDTELHFFHIHTKG